MGQTQEAQTAEGQAGGLGRAEGDGRRYGGGGGQASRCQDDDGSEDQDHGEVQRYREQTGGRSR